MTALIDLQLVLEPDPRADQAHGVELARELRELLRRELAAPVTIRSADRTVPDRHGEDVSRGDPVAIAALVLSIPGAALALHDLAARIKLKDCLHRVLVRAREHRARAIWRASADHVALPGEEERALDEIIDELVRSQDPARID
jgi:hypothetical protein